MIKSKFSIITPLCRWFNLTTCFEFIYKTTIYVGQDKHVLNIIIIFRSCFNNTFYTYNIILIIFRKMPFIRNSIFLDLLFFIRFINDYLSRSCSFCFRFCTSFPWYNYPTQFVHKFEPSPDKFIQVYKQRVLRYFPIFFFNYCSFQLFDLFPHYPFYQSS